MKKLDLIANARVIVAVIMAIFPVLLNALEFMPLEAIKEKYGKKITVNDDGGYIHYFVLDYQQYAL